MVLPATAGVSRTTFCHDDSHIDSQAENNTSVAVVTGYNLSPLKCEYQHPGGKGDADRQDLTQIG